MTVTDTSRDTIKNMIKARERSTEESRTWLLWSRTWLLWATMGALFVALAPMRASAQFDEYESQESDFESPDEFNLELHVGVYKPNEEDRFGQFFSGDNGPKVGGEFAYMPFRIPYVGRAGFAGQVGWARFSGSALVVGLNDQTDESTRLVIYPIPVTGNLQVDVLAREFGVPLYFTAKLGADLVPWRSNTGSDSFSGFAVGLRWAGQLALELDWIEPKKARALDDDWGINHSYLFFEAYGSTAKDGSLDLGTNFAWDMGLGMVF